MIMFSRHFVIQFYYTSYNITLVMVNIKASLNLLVRYQFHFQILWSLWLQKNRWAVAVCACDNATRAWLACEDEHDFSSKKFWCNKKKYLKKLDLSLIYIYLIGIYLHIHYTKKILNIVLVINRVYMKVLGPHCHCDTGHIGTGPVHSMNA